MKEGGWMEDLFIYSISQRGKLLDNYEFGNVFCALLKGRMKE